MYIYKSINILEEKLKKQKEIRLKWSLKIQSVDSKIEAIRERLKILRKKC